MKLDHVYFDTNEWGLKGKEVVHISTVQSGLACDCICPDCKDNLIAKKGDINLHHFAHASNEIHASCGETKLHLEAKEILRSNLSTITLPAITSDSELLSKNLILDTCSYRVLEYTDCLVEQDRATYRPDVTVFGPSLQQLDIEIKVTHAVDDDKAIKVREANVEMIEIDLSNYYGKRIEYTELINIVGQDAPRKWVHHIMNEDHHRVVAYLNSVITDTSNALELAQLRYKTLFEVTTQINQRNESKVTSAMYQLKQQNYQNEMIQSEMLNMKYRIEELQGINLITRHDRTGRAEFHSVEELFRMQLPD